MSLREDLTRQRRALLLALAMIVAGLGAAGLSYLFREEALDGERQAQVARDGFQARLARIAQEEKEIQAGDALFRRFAERGILGEEKRMDWIESIARIQAQRRLYDIRWEISPQRPLEAEFAPRGTGELEFMASTLHLEIALLHEEDLLRFLSDLRDSLPAYVRIRQCSLARQSQAGASPLERNAPQLQAECQMDLITLKARGATPPKQP
jgi:hypothetical protein